ncbi:MAG: hypothetical protein JO280_05675, partial [Mycobacteriaceae bacterium]|nr:hypothetical protein [Mycobacteriaceae bacterium]
MHRPRSVLRTSTAVLLCSVLVGACVAKVHGATGLQSGYRGFAALATAAPAAGAPPTATAAFDGLETRVQQAALAAADSGAVIS